MKDKTLMKIMVLMLFSLALLAFNTGCDVSDSLDKASDTADKLVETAEKIDNGVESINEFTIKIDSVCEKCKDSIPAYSDVFYEDGKPKSLGKIKEEFLTKDCKDAVMDLIKDFKKKVGNIGIKPIKFPKIKPIKIFNTSSNTYEPIEKEIVNEFTKNIFNFSKGEDEDGVFVSFLAADENGEADKTVKSDEIEVFIDNGDYLAPVQSNEVEIIDNLTDYDYTGIGKYIAISNVLDYSGSMGYDDLIVAQDMYSDIYNELPAKYFADVIFFSSIITRKLPFSVEKNIVIDGLKYDAFFQRKATKLYDAIGTGIENLKSVEANTKILIVSTDGMENYSNQYTKEKIIQEASANNIKIIALGSTFSDELELKEFAEGTNGLYVWVHRHADLQDELRKIVSLIKNSYIIKIKNKKYKREDKVRISINGKNPIEF